MNDGNESGKDGELVCTGMVWKRRGRGGSGGFVKGRVPFKPAVSPRTHVFAGLGRHSGNRKQEICYRRKLVLLQGSHVSDASKLGWRANRRVLQGTEDEDLRPCKTDSKHPQARVTLAGRA